MTDRVSLDLHELDELIADLGTVDARLQPQVRAVLQKGALNIKTRWRQLWSGHPHAPALPYAVTYDTHILATAIRAEIGPEKSKPQGALGNLFEFGSVNNAPIPGGQPALDEEEPRFLDALAGVASVVATGRR